MLEFVGSGGAGRTDQLSYRHNVGPGGVTTIFVFTGTCSAAGCTSTSCGKADGMSLIGRIEQELKDARLARDEDRRDALSLILSSLRSAEKELQRPFSDDEELQVLQRERKRRLEAAEALREGRSRGAGRAEEFELDVLENSCRTRSRRTSWKRSSTT